MIHFTLFHGSLPRVKLTLALNGVYRSLKAFKAPPEGTKGFPFPPFRSAAVAKNVGFH